MSLRILKYCFCFAMFLISPFLGVAQDPSQSVIVSPSPSSASAARYSEVPVDLSTGIPQISLPLYVIQSAKLSYPISMSYHASGIKVNDVAGPLGTGWTLNSGGLINRIMRNRPDEQTNGFFSNASAIPNQTDPLTLAVKENIANRATDMMPDLFYYSTGTIAGKIIFDNQLVPRTIPLNSIKITTPTSTLSTFKLSDPSGTNYEFDAGETATAAIPGAGSVSYLSSWYLSRIVSADKLDTIRFNYTPYPNPYSYTTSENAGLNYFYNAPSGAARALNEMNSINSNLNITVTGTRYLTSIEYKGGKVSFVFSGRTDDVNGKKLDQIIVYSKDPVSGTNVEDKRINFSFTYFDNSDSGTRLRLDSYREQINATNNPPYTFKYSTNKLPAPGSNAQDYWGYHNGAITNTSLTPPYANGSFVVSTNNRNVDPAYVDGCIIKSITSPLGGVTEFLFESNKYLNGTVDTNGPGLRVSKIINKDPYTSINSITNYEYLNPVSLKSSGYLMNTPNYITDLAVVDNSHGNWYYYNCTLIKTGDTGVGNFSGPPLIYEYVTTYTNDNRNTTGMTVSKFTIYTPPTIAFPYFPVDDNSWTAGDLLTQEVYKVVGGVSTLVKKIENTYNLGPYVYTIKGLSVAANKIFFFTTPGVNDFVLKNYYTYAKFNFLRETKIYNYEQNSGTTNSLVTQTFYYDKTDTHLFVTKAETTTSTSTAKVKKEYTYVADYPSTGVTGVMKNLNMTGLPIDVTTSLVKSGTDYITDYQKTEYYEWKPNRVYPKNFYDAKIPLNTLKSAFVASPGTYTRLNSRINAYSKSGIALETEVIGDSPKSIIVDNCVNRVVAGADASSTNQVAFCGFESKDYGNWKISTGTTTPTINISMTLSHTFETIVLSTNQTVYYSYTVTKTNGPSPVMVFTKNATTVINAALLNASGGGSVSLTTGTWYVRLEYDFNVTAIASNFSYQITVPTPPTIVTANYKTGQRSLQLGANTVSRDSLPTGNYTIVYYQKGTVSLSTTGGASVVTTITSPTEADGWAKVQKEISITSLSGKISITGTASIYIDELRLYPSGSFMSTTSYDGFKNTISKTDANLRSQLIEYDVKRRVLVIRDHEKNILQHYDYKFAIN